MKRLLHFSHEPLGKLHSQGQMRCPYMKPRGLWVSVDDAWERWVVSTGAALRPMATSYFDHATEITFTPDARVLRIDDCDARKAFHEEFQKDYGIEWHRVAERYGAIIIDVDRSLRSMLDTPWHASWDIPSGCIWDASIIVTHPHRSPPSC